LFYTPQRALVLWRPTQRLEQEHDHIHIGDCVDRRAVHEPVHRLARLAVQTRRVDEHDLNVATRVHGQDAVPRRLGLRRND